MRRVAVVAVVAAAVLVWLAASWRREASQVEGLAAAGTGTGVAAGTPTGTGTPTGMGTPTGTGAASERENGSEAEGAEMAASAAVPGAKPVPVSDLRRDFESQPRDASAAQAEARIRQVFDSHPGNEGVLREVRCTATVCELQARWSQAVTVAYNAALVQLVGEFSRELQIEPAGEPDGMVVPINVLIRRSASQGTADLTAAR